MNGVRTVLLCFILNLALATGAEAQICRWKDAAGKTHYSDAPPPGIQCEGSVKAPKPSPSGGSPSAGGTSSSYQEKEMEFRKRRQEKLEAEQKAQKEKEIAEQNKAACEQARNRISGLQRGGRAARYDASGQINYLSEEEIARELAEAQRALKDICK